MFCMLIKFCECDLPQSPCTSDEYGEEDDQDDSEEESDNSEKDGDQEYVTKYVMKDGGRGFV